MGHEAMNRAKLNPGLLAFVRESNLIEGIEGSPSNKDIEAHLRLLDRGLLLTGDLVVFVFDVADAPLRAYPGMDVRVGPHTPPRGGPAIRQALEELLYRATREDADPYLIHCEYESLHPFMDGNGRSGRALWLWMMLRQGNGDQPLNLGFLHSWYYQSLQHWPARGERPQDPTS